MFYSNISVLLISAYESIHHRIIQSSVTSQTTHYYTHIYTSTTKHTITNAIMSTTSTHNTLRKYSIRCTCERIEKLSAAISDTHHHLMSTRLVGGVGVAHEQTRVFGKSVDAEALTQKTINLLRARTPKSKIISLFLSRSTSITFSNSRLY